MTHELLTTDETAAMLRVSRNTLYDWKYRGEGPKSFKAGTGSRSKLLYRRSDVETYIEQRYQEG